MPRWCAFSRDLQAAFFPPALPDSAPFPVAVGGYSFPHCTEIRMNAFTTRPARAAAGFVFACIASVTTPAFADVLASWNPSGTVDSNAPLPPSASNALISAGNLTGSPGLTSPGPFANAYEFDNWPSGALDTGDYLAFSMSGNITYATIAFSLYNNFDGSGNWEIRSSGDAYA